MTPRYFREAHQVGHRRVGHASVLGGRCPAAYLVKVAVDQSTTEPSISNQAPPLTTRPPRAGREHVASSTQREDIVEIDGARGYKPKSQSGSASCAPVAREPPERRSDDAGDLSPAIFDRSHADVLATWPPGTTGDDPPAGCPRSRRVDVSTRTRSAVWSPSPAAWWRAAASRRGCRSCRSACPSRRCKFGAAVRDQTSGRRGCWPSSACAGGKWAAGR